MQTVVFLALYRKIHLLGHKYLVPAIASIKFNHLHSCNWAVVLSPFPSPTFSPFCLCFSSKVKSYDLASLWSQWLLPTLSATIYNKCHHKVSAFGGISLQSLTVPLLFWESKLTINACPEYVVLLVVAEITHSGKRKSPWKLPEDVTWIIYCNGWRCFQ